MFDDRKVPPNGVGSATGPSTKSDPISIAGLGAPNQDWLHHTERKQLYRPGPISVSKVRLLELTDREYYGVAAISRELNEYQHERPAEVSASPERDLFALHMGRLGETIENATRMWLSRYFPLSERRGLLFNKQQPPGARRDELDGTKHLELDAVSFRGDKPDIVFELKFGFQRSLLRRAVKQLNERAEVLVKLNRGIRAVAVLVACNPKRLSNEDEIVVGKDLLLDTDKVASSILNKDITRLILPPDPIIALAKEMNLPLEAAELTSFSARRDSLVRELEENETQTKLWRLSQQQLSQATEVNEHRRDTGNGRPC